MDNQKITIESLNSQLDDFSVKTQELKKAIPDSDTKIAFDSLAQETFYMLDSIIRYLEAEIEDN